MLPFKVFDRDKKTTWVIVNYHPSKDGGEYLAAREDDTTKDGELEIFKVQALKRFKMVGFVSHSQE